MNGQADRRVEVLNSAPLDSWIALSNDESNLAPTGSSYDEAVRNGKTGWRTRPRLIKTPKIWMPVYL
jgi:hypothetical protein